MSLRLVLASLLVLVSSSVAFAQFPEAGSSYFIAPGAGTVSGFQLAGGPFEESVIDGDGELIGLDLSGGGMILSTDTLIQNTMTNFDLVFRLETVGGNLAPAGIIGDSGVELTTLGIFVGGGLNPVDLDGPLLANSAYIEDYDSAEQSLGIISVVDFGNFTSGEGGGWDGSLGINFGNQVAIGDVGAIEFRINFDTAAVPEPGSALLLGTIALVGVTRRRRA